MPPLKRAVFLDRDGTITQDAGYTYELEDFRFVENALAGLAVLAELDFALVLVTNQSGIGRGVFTVAEMTAFNQHLVAELGARGIVLTAVYYCPYHPDAGVGEWRRDSPDRKPRPGMFLRAAEEHSLDLSRSYAIGDKKSDIVAGQAAGCFSIMVMTGESERDPESGAEPDHTASDLLEAAQFIRAREAR